MSSSLKLEELVRLKKSSSLTRTTSVSVPIEVPTGPNDEKPVVSLALPTKKKVLRSLEQIEANVGGREHIVETLALATLDKREAHFLNLLSDPMRAEDSIDDIARDAGLKPLQVVDLFRTAAFAKAHAISSAQLAAALPAVVEDIASKAVDAKITCPTCFGDGRDAQNEVCMQCNGRGEVMRFSDLDRQKIILETAGMTKKQSGVNVNVNQQVGIVNPSGFFSKFVADSDPIANDILDIEGEVLATEK